MSHAKIAELLPWYVNGTLPMGERQSAALEVASCDACAAEVDELAKIQTAMLELEATAPEPSGRGLARALDAIEKEEERKRLGHPWFGWWWSLTPWRRALVVSSALGALVVFGIFITPKPAPESLASYGSTNGSTPIALERIAPASYAANAVVGRDAGAPAPAAAAKTGQAQLEPSMQSTGQVARTAGMSLIVPDVEKAIGSVSATARAEGGEMLSLDDETPTQPGVVHTAHVEIGVPQLRFESTLDALGKIGGVQSRSVGAEDVSTQIVDGQARLRNLRSTESDLLKIMSRAGKIDDVLAVENQVSSTREQIEQLDAEVQALQHRVAMSTVTVDLQDEAPARSVSVGIGAQLASSWAAALGSVKAFTIAIVGALLWIVAYGPYVLGVALAGGIVAASRRRF
ncbi:MAG TPA: DUF4349 domain-containing protein [Candidatus Eremiobacteraceae bacterium]|nr:DUF4349 domain-containing protein [Candidatus Eremiobacteraceae bacterium]